MHVGLTGRVIKRGEIYYVPDGLIKLPKSQLKGERVEHEARPVLVLQTDLDNQNPLYPIILVAPLSHRVDLQDDKDYRLNVGQGGIKQDSLVQLGLTQPILKIDLVGNPIGQLDDLVMEEINAVLAANLGLIQRYPAV
jgi:mRNA-degrading endonuclease toxin of MazEF toxin-antitoxin module